MIEMDLWKLVREILDVTEDKSYSDVEKLSILNVVVKAWTRIEEAEG